MSGKMHWRPDYVGGHHGPKQDIACGAFLPHYDGEPRGPRDVSDNVAEVTCKVCLRIAARRAGLDKGAPPEMIADKLYEDQEAGRAPSCPPEGPRRIMHLAVSESAFYKRLVPYCRTGRKYTLISEHPQDVTCKNCLRKMASRGLRRPYPTPYFTTADAKTTINLLLGNDP